MSRLLALDPGSRLAGYAVLSAGPSLIECGLLKPRGGAKKPWWSRAEQIAGDAAQLIIDHGITRVVIEAPSKHVGARHKGGGAGLAIYGAAVGWIAATLRHEWCYHERTLHLVSADEWKAGARGKPQMAAQAMFPRGYDARQDPGGDCADAIMLAIYWLERERIRANEAAA